MVNELAVEMGLRLQVSVLLQELYGTEVFPMLIFTMDMLARLFEFLETVFPQASVQG